jgi:hypothetical protein
VLATRYSRGQPPLQRLPPLAGSGAIIKRQLRWQADLKEKRRPPALTDRPSTQDEDVSERLLTSNKLKRLESIRHLI